MSVTPRRRGWLSAPGSIRPRVAPRRLAPQWLTQFSPSTVAAEVVEVFVRSRMVRGETERMRAGAQRDNRDAAGHGGGETPHHVVGPLAEPQRQHEAVGGVELRGVAEAGVVVGIDRAVGIERKQHRAAEAVALAEDLGEHRQPFLAAVFLVAGEKHQVPAGARAGAGRIRDGFRGGVQRAEERGGHDEAEDERAG
jgi:hypothetical protein